MPEEYENNLDRDRSPALNNASENVGSESAPSGGINMDQHLAAQGQQGAEPVVEEVPEHSLTIIHPPEEVELGDDGAANGSGTGSGAADATPNDGLAGSGQESEEEDETSADGLNFALGPVKLKLAEDFSAIEQASFDFGGKKDLPPSTITLKNKRAGSGYSAELKNYPIEGGSFAGFAFNAMAINTLKVSYSANKGASIDKLDVGAQGLAFGEYAALSQLDLKYKKGEYKGTVGNLQGGVMGYGYQAMGGEVAFSAQGGFDYAKFTNLNISAPRGRRRDNNTAPTPSLSAQALDITGEGLSFTGVHVQLPEIMGKTAFADFQNLQVPNGGAVTGEGSIASDSEFSFLNDKLKVSNLSSTVSIAEDAWAISAQGSIESLIGGSTTVAGTVNMSYDTSTSSTQVDINDGSFVSDLGGLQLTAEGLSYSTETQKLGIERGQVQVPGIQSQLSATLNNASYSAETGFDFDSIQLSMAQGFQVVPGVTIQASDLELRKLAEADYAFDLIDAIAEVSLGSFSGSLIMDLAYNKAEGIHGTVKEFETDSPYFGFYFQNAPFTGEGFGVESAKLELRNMGPASGLEATAQGIEYNQSGLSISQVSANLPPIGGVNIKAEVTDFAATAAGITVGSAKVDAEGDISLFNNAVLIKQFAGDVRFEGGAWGFDASGDMELNVPNLEGSGKVELGYNNGQPDLNVSDGQLAGQFGPVDFKATDLNLSYGETKALSIGNAEVKINEIPDLELEAEVNNATIDDAGFNVEGIALRSKGSFEPLTGFRITDLAGGLKKEGDSYAVDMQAAAIRLRSSVITGEVKDLRLGYGPQEKYLGFKRLNFVTPVLKGYVTESEIANKEVNMEKASVLFNGLAPEGGPLRDIDKNKITAEGLVYNEEGFSLAKGEGKFPKIAGRDIKATVYDLNVPAEGGITGRGEIDLGGDISLAGGAVSIKNLTPFFEIKDDTWEVGAKGNLGLNVSGAQAQGDVTVRYGSEGPIVEVENGSMEAELLNGALGVKAEEISFDSQGIATGGGGLLVKKGTMAFPKLGDGNLEAEVQNLSVSGQGFGFTGAALNGLGQTLQIFPGLSVTVNSATASKPSGGALNIGMGVTVDVNRTNAPRVQGSASGTLNYNTATGFSGSVSSISLNTGLFSAQAQGLSFDREGGLAVDEARIGMGNALTAENLAPYFPALAQNAWLLDFLQGVSLVGQDISYNKDEGLKMGFIYPDIPPVKFDIMGMEGEIDFKEQKGSLMANKRWTLADLKIPEQIGGEMPIIPGLAATFGINLGANINLGAGLELQRRSSDGAWVVNGKINFDGDLRVGGYLGVKAGSDWLISVGASLNLDIATLFDGDVTLGTALQYDSVSKGISLVDPIKFKAQFLANLIADLYIKLEGRAFLVFGTEKIYNLARHEFGSMDFLAEAESNELRSLFSNLSTHLKFYDGDKKLIKEF